MKDMPTDMEVALLAHLVGMIEGGRADRISWWAHWAVLANNYLPRRYKWFVTPNASQRGAQMNQNIVDETGVLAARTCANGMLSGLTSPSRPWFKLKVKSKVAMTFGPVKDWLAECERVMYGVFAGSNFYQAMGVLNHDNVIFGSACMIEYEDKKDVVRFYNPCLGEFFFFVDERLVVSGMGREFTYTVQQCVDQFRIENVSETVRESYKQGGANRLREVVIDHVIEKNTPLWIDGGKEMLYVVPQKFAYRECFWEQGQASSGNRYLNSCSGFNEKPFIGARWDVTSNDAYGRSPGMDGLPATMQTQIEQRRKAEAIDKMVRPPMVAHPSMRNEPASILPGAVNYVADTQNVGFKPAFLVDPRLAEMTEDIKEVQARTNSIFFVDLFMMISSLDTVRTATEIDARREEKMIQLGPVIERMENEVLDGIIERTFAICSRRGLFPPAPQEIQGSAIEIEYVSVLAQAQAAASTAAIERIFGLVGNVAAVRPEVGDNIDWDLALEQYADDLSLPPKLIVPLKQVMAVRAARAKAQQSAAIADATPGAAMAAKNLSQTQLGSGRSALDEIVGNS